MRSTEQARWGRSMLPLVLVQNHALHRASSVGAEYVALLVVPLRGKRKPRAFAIVEAIDCQLVCCWQPLWHVPAVCTAIALPCWNRRPHELAELPAKGRLNPRQRRLIP